MEVIIDPKLKQYIELHEKALKKRDAAAMYQLGGFMRRVKSRIAPNGLLNCIRELRQRDLPQRSL